MFEKIAKSYGFEKSFGGLFMESDECIIVLDLQKSNFGNYYDLNIKIFVQGVFGKAYKKTKDLVKKDVGDIFRRQPDKYKDLFNLDIKIEDIERKKVVESFFDEFIEPFINNGLSKSGIKYLAKKGEIFLLPAVEKELTRIG